MNKSFEKKFKERFKVIVAVYIIFRDDDEILLLRRANTGYFDGHYSLPAGHIDGNESVISAAIREAKEEVGATVDEQDLTLVHVMHRISDLPSTHERVDFYFQTTKKHADITNNEPNKCDEVKWYKSDSLPGSIVPEVKLALDKIVNNELYSDYQFDNMMQGSELRF